MPLEDLARLALTLALGFAGAQLAVWVKMPAGAVLGPMLLVGALNILGAPLLQLGAPYRYAAQILVGGMMAASITPATARAMLRLVGPAALGVILLITLGVLGGWGLHRLAGVPLASALFAGAPGGAADMALASADVGGDVELVAALHVVRQLAVVMILPVLLRFILRPR